MPPTRDTFWPLAYIQRSIKCHVVYSRVYALHIDGSINSSLLLGIFKDGLGFFFIKMVYLRAIRVHMPSLHTPPEVRASTLPSLPNSTFHSAGFSAKPDGTTRHTVYLVEVQTTESAWAEEVHRHTSLC